jgi:hypothetical protein
VLRRLLAVICENGDSKWNHGVGKGYVIHVFIVSI